MLNSMGQLVHKQSDLTGQKIEIDITNLAMGVYTLKIIEGEKISRVKMLKR